MPNALTRAALPLLRAGKGRIVHIGSVGGRISSPGLDAEGRQRYQWLIDQARGFIDEGRHMGVPAAKLAGYVLTRLPDRARDAMQRIGSRRWERRGAALRGNA
jgi:NAD(P)-dependent dehydrogenase (short-subunit alcohol dehydrogenase family)